MHVQGVAGAAVTCRAVAVPGADGLACDNLGRMTYRGAPHLGYGAAGPSWEWSYPGYGGPPRVFRVEPGATEVRYAPGPRGPVVYSGYSAEAPPLALEVVPLYPYRWGDSRGGLTAWAAYAPPLGVWWVGLVKYR